MITQERLRELLDYDKETGMFTWRCDQRTGKGAGRVTIKAGSVAGSFDGRYIKIGIDGNSIRAHRLAFLHVTGEFPSLHVDHIDGNGTNNAWANLRNVNASINLHNQVHRKARNKTGYRGVARNHKRYAAQIVVASQYQYLGTFDTPQEASAAYMAAKQKLTPMVAA